MPHLTKYTRFLVSFTLVVLVASCDGRAEIRVGAPRQPETWRAIHLIDYSTDNDVELLIQNIPRLAEMGINVMILEVDYNFNFKSHPELRRGDNPITKQAARRLAEASRSTALD